MWRRSSEEPRGEFGALVVAQDNDDALARLKAFEPFQVLLVDDQRPLRVGDVTVAEDGQVLRGHKADRFHSILTLPPYSSKTRA